MLKGKLNRLLCLIVSFLLAFAALPVSPAFAADVQQLEGDVNYDGKINSLDLIVFKMCLLGIKNAEDSYAFDVNRDGGIDSSDYAVLKAMVLNSEGNNDTKVIEGNTNFAFDIFKTVNREDYEKNIFISPLSISTALSMVYQGAEGSTKEEMEKTLKYEGLDINTINQGYVSILTYLNNIDPKVTLGINNSIWYRNGFNVDAGFLDTNKNVFNSYIAALNFASPEAADTINAWIKNATNGMIPKMLDSPIPEDIIMYLINAIYFKGQWTNVFNGDDSFYGNFKTGNGESKKVVYMKKRTAMDYGEGSDYKAVRLPYGNGSTSMYCILPASDISVNDYIEGLTAEKWNAIRQSIKNTEDVSLEFPRFKMEYGSVSLNNALESLGMENAFYLGANFSGIAPGIFIGDVNHKAVIEVNEDGTEAAAVTAVSMTESIPPEPTNPQFIADRPFVFLITDERKGNILFMGKAFELDKY